MYIVNIGLRAYSILIIVLLKSNVKLINYNNEYSSGKSNCLNTEIKRPTHSKMLKTL